MTTIAAARNWRANFGSARRAQRSSMRPMTKKSIAPRPSGRTSDIAAWVQVL